MVGGDGGPGSGTFFELGGDAVYTVSCTEQHEYLAIASLDRAAPHQILHIHIQRPRDPLQHP
jgi:hypothetical protein